MGGCHEAFRPQRVVISFCTRALELAHPHRHPNLRGARALVLGGAAMRWFAPTESCYFVLYLCARASTSAQTSRSPRRPCDSPVWRCREVVRPHGELSFPFCTLATPNLHTSRRSCHPKFFSTVGAFAPELAPAHLQIKRPCSRVCKRAPVYATLGSEPAAGAPASRALRCARRLQP